MRRLRYAALVDGGEPLAERVTKLAAVVGDLQEMLRLLESPEAVESDR